MADILSGLQTPMINISKPGDYKLPYLGGSSYMNAAQKLQELNNSRTDAETAKIKQAAAMDDMEEGLLDQTASLLYTAPVEQRPLIMGDLKRRAEGLGLDISHLPDELDDTTYEMFKTRHYNRVILPNQIKSALKQQELAAEYGYKSDLEGTKAKNAQDLALLNNQNSYDIASMNNEARSALADKNFTNNSALEDQKGQYRIDAAKARANSVKIPANVALQIQENNGFINSNNNTISQSVSLFNDIQSGKLPLGVFTNFKYDAQNKAGMSSKQSVEYDRLQQTVNSLVNNKIIQQKGVATEGDAQRAKDEILNNLSDPKIVSSRLAYLIKLNRSAASELSQQNKDLNDYYTGENPDLLTNRSYGSNPQSSPKPNATPAPTGSFKILKVE